MKSQEHKIKKNIPEKTNYGPGRTPLYYKNVGLFADPFLEDRLPNSYKESSADFLCRVWNIEESPEFNESFQKILDIWNELEKRVPDLCENERQLQNRWIDKIFKALGWEVGLEEKISRNGQTNFPDYGLYKNFDDWKRSKSLKGSNKFKRTLAIADAKSWGTNLDGKSLTTKNPSYQIIHYLNQTDKCWGILTDGQYWRIYTTRSESKHTTYYEIDLIKILDSGDLRRFNYFYNFFRKDAFLPLAEIGGYCFLDYVFDEGQFYAKKIEKDLRLRTEKVLDMICGGFFDNYKKSIKRKLEEKDFKDIYDHSAYYLFKLIFVLNCESKGLLEITKQDDYYEYSLRKKCLDIRERYETGKNWSGQSRTYDYVLYLFDLLKNGDKNIGVYGFGNEPFDAGCEKFYINNKISDEVLNKVLIVLAFEQEEEKDLQFIDYKALSPDHIGSLFEGLLELKPASDKKGKGMKLVQDKSGRKDTGSYYTPLHITEYMVDKVLTNCLKKKGLSEKLNIKICDPSMGSANFLLACLKHLELKIQEYVNDSQNEGFDLSNIQNTILEKCIYGIDVNPLATELAKFSLWMHASRKGEKLAKISQNLVSADSLDTCFSWEKRFGFMERGDGFDAIVGNPPYVASKNTRINSDAISGGQTDLYIQFVNNFTSGNMLKKNGVFSMIIPDSFLARDNAKQVREKIVTEYRIEEVLHVGKVFKDASVSNAILFVKKSAKKNNKLRVHKIKDGSDRNSFSQKESFTIRQSNIIDYENSKFLYLINDERYELYRSIQKRFCKMEDFFTVGRGEELGKKALEENESKNGKKILIAGEGIRSFGIEESKITTVPSRLIKKNDDHYRTPKVILQKSSPKFVAAYDKKAKDILYVTQTVYIIKGKGKLDAGSERILLHFVTGLLNSDFANKYLFEKATGYKLVMPHFAQKDINEFPVSNINNLDFDLVKKLFNSLESGVINISNKSQINLEGEEGFVSAVSHLATILSSVENPRESQWFAKLNNVIDSFYCRNVSVDEDMDIGFDSVLREAA